MSKLDHVAEQKRTQRIGVVLDGDDAMWGDEFQTVLRSVLAIPGLNVTVIRSKEAVRLVNAGVLSAAAAVQDDPEHSVFVRQGEKDAVRLYNQCEAFIYFASCTSVCLLAAGVMESLPLALLSLTTVDDEPGEAKKAVLAFPFSIEPRFLSTLAFKQSVKSLEAGEKWQVVCGDRGALPSLDKVLQLVHNLIDANDPSPSTAASTIETTSVPLHVKVMTYATLRTETEKLKELVRKMSNPDN